LIGLAWNFAIINSKLVRQRKSEFGKENHTHRAFWMSNLSIQGRKWGLSPTQKRDQSLGCSYDAKTSSRCFHRLHDWTDKQMLNHVDKKAYRGNISAELFLLCSIEWLPTAWRSISLCYLVGNVD
jgi:hypothetical protein